MIKNKEAEPLYIIYYRDPQAEEQLQNWLNANPSASAVIQGCRMKLYTTQSLNLFQIGWKGNWNMVAVWDTWNRRHIYFQ